MSTLPRRRLVAGIAAAAAASLALTGCSTGLDEADAGTTEGAGDDSALESGFGVCNDEPVDGIDLEGALELINRYQQPADGLLISDPLTGPVDPTTTFAFVDNGTTVSAIMWEAFSDAAETAGVSAERVNAGTDAQGINSAFNSIVERPSDVVVAPAIDPIFFADQIATLEAAGTIVISAATTNAEEFGLRDNFGGYGASIENGAVLAAAAIAMTCGQDTEFVFYNIPEFAFSQVQLSAAEEALEGFCGGACNLRVVDIPVGQMATGGPDAVLSDLQAHPETAAFITPVDELQVGLPAKMDLAGISVPGLGQSSTPPNVEQIMNGTQAGGFAVDLTMFMWLLLDQGLRLDQDMTYPELDWAEINPNLSTILTRDNAEEALDGYISVPTYRDDFSALWGV
ncbi:substrate-binding domain-containing protein [Pseudoclavibacter endophyticus]|nr:substrate-binding domain-containing protein [Pseudoclavibacter endophyticus]